MRLLRLSAETEYAYVALMRLARDYGSKVSTKLSEIIGPQNLSEKFMLQVLTDLRRAGYVVSRRGKSGGYALAVMPTKITLGDLLAAMAGEADEDAASFDIAGPTSCLAVTMRQLQAEFQKRLAEITLADAIVQEDRGGAMMYHI